MKSGRYIFMNVILFAVGVVFAFKLINLQVVHGEYYREKSDARTTRMVELIAPRGEILDRYGKSIVKNRTGYSVYIQWREKRESEELNVIINNLFTVMPSFTPDMTSVLPLAYQEGRYIFAAQGKEAHEWKKNNGFDKGESAENVMKKLQEKYSIDDSYTPEEALKILYVRLDMKQRGFSKSNAYLIREDVPLDEIAVIKEQSSKFPDVCVIAQPVREYPYGSLAAHLLGRVGAISSEEYESNKDMGYTMNSGIGKDGIEKYLESYLRGENGRGTVEQTGSGFSLGEKVEKEPVSGRNVSLTIDLDLQIACEKALAETIAEIRGNASDASGGLYADAGSVVVIDVNSGEVLAMASYPSYDIKTFSTNYNTLLNDPSKPLFNRSLAGTYSPASSFKILVGAAALEEGVITTDEKILDTGKYLHFRDYQPACWIYNQTGGSHGYENVTEAIRDSCNVFFYETGRRLTIEKIGEYAKKFGFGEKSGIELAAEEKTGVVASPENREKSGGIWYPGDVCQTAIGQSDTLVTPLQLANYIATVANGGTRYKPHIIRSVENLNKKQETETEIEVLEEIKLKEENYTAVREGIRKVVTEGTAFNAFHGCEVSVAAKTGSAQTGRYTNGICVAYAPYDKPRIAIACVIEKAGSGSRTAGAIRKIVDSYFDSEKEHTENPVNTLLR